ncbi:ABC transporter ATP-binding protein [Hutsoniella sourekii]
MNPLIKLEEVSWIRQGKTILSGINWQTYPGEHWAIIGLNGSGKTSLLNIINGYSFPSQGQVQVLDTTFGKGSLPKLRESIGFISSALDRYESTFRRQTVSDLILSGKFASIGLYPNQEVTEGDQVLVKSLADAVGMGPFLNRHYFNLSQGEKRRALIARALMSQPKLLILDEPCTGLDLLARERLLQQMEELALTTQQLIYVTHYIEEITPIITHVLLLKDGQIVSQGPKEEVLTSERLTQTFQVPIQLHWQDQRPWITIHSQK